MRRCSLNMLKARTRGITKAHVWTRCGPFGMRESYLKLVSFLARTVLIVPSYETARKIKVEQDTYCSKALAGEWSAIKDQSFPENLQWESLVEILRGRVKVCGVLA